MKTDIEDDISVAQCRMAILHRQKQTLNTLDSPGINASLVSVARSVRIFSWHPQHLLLHLASSCGDGCGECASCGALRASQRRQRQ